MRKYIKLDIAINYVCYWFIFCCHFLKASLKRIKCKTFLISQFLQAYHQLLLLKSVNWTIGDMITSRSISRSIDDLYRAYKLIRLSVPFHAQISRSVEKAEMGQTLASDGVIKKDNVNDNSLAHLLCQVIYVTSFNKLYDLRYFLNH